MVKLLILFFITLQMNPLSVNLSAVLYSLFGRGDFKVYTPNGVYTLEVLRNGITLFYKDREGRFRRVGDEEANRILGGKALLGSSVDGPVFLNNGEIQEIPGLNGFVTACMFGEYTLVVTYSMLFVFKGTALVLTRNTREIEDFFIPDVRSWKVSHDDDSHEFQIESRGVTLWTFETWEYTPEMKSIVEEAFDRNHVPVDCLRVVEALLA